MKCSTIVSSVMRAFMMMLSSQAVAATVDSGHLLGANDEWQPVLHSYKTSNDLKFSVPAEVVCTGFMNRMFSVLLKEEWGEEHPCRSPTES